MSDSGTSESGRLTVSSPFDGATLAQLAKGDLRFVDDALARATRLFRDRAGWLPVAERIGLLTRTATRLGDEAENLALLIAREGGKPLTDARIEVARGVEGLQLCAEHIRSDAGSRIPLAGSAMTAGRIGFTGKEPIGVVAAVSAFNHPLNLIVHQIGPAIAAGCPVIVKPSEDTPLCCLRLVELLRESGLPEPWCQVLITDDIPVAEALVTDPRVAFFSFIGSARVGWMLRSKLAAGTRCALEHGGAAPLIITDDADLDAAVPAILKGGFYHAGQVCVSVQRVFAPRAVSRQLGARLATGAKALRVGDPTSAETQVGPLIRPREVTRVAAWVTEALAEGTELLTGGELLEETLYAPTVLYDPPTDARVSREEIFGPVVCLYPYDELDEAIRRANELDVAFQAAVFARDMDTALAVANRLDASAVMINDHTAFRADAMPFAGLRQSGLGVGGIPYTLDDMQVDKLIVIRSDSV